jgi:aspartate/methionine/tyrosine aminotransferase
VWFLIQLVGDGTKRLGAAKQGDIINVVLPLGNSFTMPEKPSDKLLLVGGGVGTAPMLYLGEQLAKNGSKPTFLLGARSDKDLLQVEGAKDVALELNSLSKTFNMAGWRVGMVSGNAACIDAVLKVKSNMDSGMFYGIQKGAIAALQSDASWFDEMNAIYAKRRILTEELAEKLGCEVYKEGVGLFVWAKLPAGITSAEDFIDKILYEKYIFITPGTIFGSNGEGYIRFALCVKEEKIEEAIRRF